MQLVRRPATRLAAQARRTAGAILQRPVPGGCAPSPTHSQNRSRLVINKRCPLRPMNLPVRPLPWTGTSLTAAAPPCPRDPTVHAAASGTQDAERPTFAVVAGPRNAGRTPAAPLRTPDRVLIATAQERSRQTVRPADWPAQIGCADPAGRTGIGCLHQLFLASRHRHRHRHRHLNLVRLCQNVELCSGTTVHRLEVFPEGTGTPGLNTRTGRSPVRMGRL